MYEKSDAAAAFVRARLLRVLRGESALGVRGLRGMGRKRSLSAAPRKKLRTVCAYGERNRERMRYDEYLAAGYPIASGAIEGACRHVVKDRMERAGMHGTVAGAQAMLEVRSLAVNGPWEEYQQYRMAAQTQRLYPDRQVVLEEYHAMAA